MCQFVVDPGGWCYLSIKFLILDHFNYVSLELYSLNFVKLDFLLINTRLMQTWLLHSCFTIERPHVVNRGGLKREVRLISAIIYRVLESVSHRRLGVKLPLFVDSLSR